MQPPDRTFGVPYLGQRGCSQPGSGPICQDRMWGRTGDTMWGSEKGTAGTGTSRRHKRAHSPSSPLSSPRAPGAPAPPGPLVLPPPAPAWPGGPCLQRPVRDAQELVGPGRCRVGAGSAQPTQVWPRRLRQRSSAPGWPRLAGWQEPPAPLAARGGRAHPVISPAAGAARAGRGRQGRHGLPGMRMRMVRRHCPPAPGSRGSLRARDPAGAPPRPMDAPDAWGRQPRSGPAAARDVPCGSAVHNDPIEVPRGGGEHPRWWWWQK